MAACGSLQHIFDKPLTETPPTLLQSLSSWNQIKPIDQPSFTEIFGELHFKENHHSSSSSSPSFPVSSFSSASSSFLDLIPQTGNSNLNKKDNLDNEYQNNKNPSLDFFSTTQKNHQYTCCHKNGDIFSPRNYESLQLCTEGLGFESFDDVEALKNDTSEDWQRQEEKVSVKRYSTPAMHGGEIRRSRFSGRAFPPPISCIGNSGKPSVSFKTYRHDGRFVLKQVRIPSREFLHAYREDGRLKLHLVQPSDEILEEEEEAGEEENYTEEDEQEEHEETGNKSDDDG